MFKQYTLLVNALIKISRLINKLISRKKQNRSYSSKDELFDI